MKHRVSFIPGEQGQRFAAIIGIDADRLAKDASVLIPSGGHAVARVEVFLTAEELREIVDMLTEEPPADG